MDSTASNPQPQQLQPPPPPTTTQQQPQAKPQQTPQPQPHQAAQAAAVAATYPPIPQFQHAAPYYTRNYPQQNHYYAAYPFPPYPPPQWSHQAPNFSPTPQQPLANMVTSQPPSNVPQQHNKPTSQIINPVMNQDQTHAQTLRQGVTMAKPATPVARIRERKPAVLKDPTTHKEVPLPNTTAAKPATTTTTTTKPSSTAQALLQKVSEDGSTAQALLQKVSEDNSATKTDTKENFVESTNGPTKVPEPEQTVVEKGDNGNQVTDTKPTPTKNPEPAHSTTTTTATELDHKPSQDNDSKESTPITDTKEAVTAQSSVEKGDKEIQEDEEEEVEEEEEEELKVTESKELTLATDKPATDNLQTLVNGEVSEDNGEKTQEKEPEAPLQYEAWQYHPISNTSGKKIYSKQFLLDVCMKVCKIDPFLISEANANSHNSQLPDPLKDKIDMFAPSFSQRYGMPTHRQNDSSRRQSQHNYAGRSSAGQEKQRKVITSVSLTQEVELKTTSNPWRPTKDIKEDAPSDVVETESLKKKFRSILNKLTPNNFESLAHAVTDLNIDTESKLGEVIDIVFAKALAEPGYCVLYGQMCSHLKRISAGAANFGNTLLRRCQHQFQSDIYSGLNLTERKEKIENEQDQEVKKQLNEELYEDMYRCRMRSLGLIKFIGELYKIDMLNDTIMFDCILRLLSDTSEESLECLCDLLVTIGERLDRSSQKSAHMEKEKKTPRAAPKANAYQGGQKSAAAVVASGSTSSQQQQKLAEQQPTNVTTLDPIFDKLHKIRKDKGLPLSVRIRFKLLDVCELREKENWQSKKTKDNNPKKIEEIRDAHREKLEQERRQQNAIGSRRSQEGRRGLGHSGSSSNQLSSLANDSMNPSSIGDNTKSTYSDHDSAKDHQKRIEALKGVLMKASNEGSKPNAGGVGLRPFMASNKPQQQQQQQ